LPRREGRLVGDRGPTAGLKERPSGDDGLETQTFEIDASMVRYAVVHAAELALALKEKMKDA